MVKNKKKHNIFGILLGIILIILTGLMIYFLKLLDVLNSKYFTIVICSLVGITIIFSIILFINSRKKLFRIVKFIIIILTLILFGVYGYTIYYLNKTMNFIDNIDILREEVTDYYFIVLNDSKYQDMSDLDGETIGYFDKIEDNVINSIKLNVNMEGSNDIDILKDKLYNKEYNCILISDIIKNKYEDDNENFSEETRILDKISIKEEIKDITKKVTMRNTPFNILISGTDQEGSIDKKGRNDVNIIVTVNPNTNKILLTTIPRDYYVQLRGKSLPKDKLTHASYYGIECVVGTIEDILDTDINYYVKVNFTTVTDLVNAIGGIEVYSDQKVTIYTGRTLNKGYNTLNGEETLAFARERHAYSDGDNHRGKNQQEVINAIFKKVTSSTSIITEYTEILEAMNGKFATNVDMNEVLSYVKYELTDLSNYTIESIQLKGSGSMGETYSYPGQNLWIMIPNQKSINSAREKIKTYLESDM